MRGLLTAALLLSFTGIASADSRSLPSTMRGLWCHAGQVGKTERYVRGGCKKQFSDNYLEVGTGTLGGHEWVCNLRKVTVVGRTYEVSSKCDGEGTAWDEKATIWLEGRSLVYRRVVSNERPDLGTLECRDHRSTPPDPDPDPVVRTLLTFADGFVVTHFTRSGKLYTRGDQYRDIRVWTNEGGNDVYWSGTWKKNQNKRMTGSLVTGNDDNYRYTEKIYDGGRVETTVVSTCASADGGRT
jgi:hypothetical protein